QARAGAEAAASEADACRARAEEFAAAAEAVVAERDAAAEQVEAARLRLTEARAGAEQAEQERQRLAEQITAQRLARSDLDHRFARLEERLRDDVDLELQRVLGEVDGFGIESHGVEGPPAPEGMVDVLLGPPLPPDQVTASRALARLWEDPA